MTRLNIKLVGAPNGLEFEKEERCNYPPLEFIDGFAQALSFVDSKIKYTITIECGLEEK